jgi:hypothetical protein
MRRSAGSILNSGGGVSAKATIANRSGGRKSLAHFIGPKGRQDYLRWVVRHWSFVLCGLAA